MTGYVEPHEPRFRVESVQGREWLKVPAQGSVFVTLFLLVWLGGWTAGAVTALRTVATRPNAFMVFWLCGWALGGLWVALLLSWFLTGSERLSADGHDLEIERRVLGRAFAKRYRGTEVRRLAVHSPQTFAWGRRGNFGGSPFFQSDRWGRVSFEYGARSVYLAGGLDDAEARRVVEWLAARLPKTARETAE